MNGADYSPKDQMWGFTRYVQTGGLGSSSLAYMDATGTVKNANVPLSSSDSLRGIRYNPVFDRWISAGRTCVLITTPDFQSHIKIPYNGKGSNQTRYFDIDKVTGQNGSQPKWWIYSCNYWPRRMG